jgi:hypothetical protein
MIYQSRAFHVTCGASNLVYSGVFIFVLVGGDVFCKYFSHCVVCGIRDPYVCVLENLVMALVSLPTLLNLDHCVSSVLGLCL